MFFRVRLCTFLFCTWQAFGRKASDKLICFFLELKHSKYKFGSFIFLSVTFCLEIGYHKDKFLIVFEHYHRRHHHHYRHHIIIINYMCVQLVCGTPCVLTLVSGSFAREMEKLSDIIVARRVLLVLQLLLKTDLPQPTHTVVTKSALTLILILSACFHNCHRHLVVKIISQCCFRR